MAALALAGLSFLEPILFGRVVDLLSRSGTMSPTLLWQDATQLLVMLALPVSVGMLLSKRIHLIGTVLRARPLEEKIAAVWREVLETNLAAATADPAADAANVAHRVDAGR